VENQSEYEARQAERRRMEEESLAAYRAAQPYPEHGVARLRDPARPNDPPIVGPEIEAAMEAEMDKPSPVFEALMSMAQTEEPTGEHPQWLIREVFPDGTWKAGAVWDAEEVTEWLQERDFSTSSRVFIERRPEGFRLDQAEEERHGR